VADVERIFSERDERFSLYLPASEASLIASGNRQLTDASIEMRDAYAESLGWREATGGAFTPHRPDGTLDLSGTIKADAIRVSAHALLSHGFDVFSINAGGDLCTAGVPEDGAWVTGISDPLTPGKVLSIVSLTPAMSCLASSGTAERGEHIWRRPETDRTFVQATVCAADIMTADVLATAIIAGGNDALNIATARGDVGVLVVKADGSLLANDLFRELVTVS
jgi:thiamine biosynthesis lipoprotein